MKLFHLILGIALVLCTLQIQANSLKKQIKAFETQIEPFRQEMENVGLAVVFVKDNKIVYTQQFGVKNMDTKEPLDENTLFRIASISKSFTTTSYMQLIEQGKVSLQTDVSQLAGFPVRNPKYPDTVITLEMLLSHTSSINDSEGYTQTIEVINPAKNPNYAKCYNNYEPGKGYEYCNLNLNMAGTFLERLSGERFDLYVKHHILDPLKLYGGYCVDSLNRQLFASLYEYKGDGKYKCTDASAYGKARKTAEEYVLGQDAIIFSPTGGMKLSAINLAKYMIMHMNYGYSPLEKVRIIPEQLSKQMQIPRSSEEEYGLSLWRADDFSPGTTLVGHTGGAYGMRSAMFFNPEKKYGYVVISGGAHPYANDGKTNILQGTIRIMHKCFMK